MEKLNTLPVVAETKITWHKHPVVCMLVARCGGLVSTIVLESSNPNIIAYRGNTSDISSETLSKYGLSFTESAWGKFTPYTEGNVILDIQVPVKTTKPKTQRKKVEQLPIVESIIPEINNVPVISVQAPTQDSTAPEGNTLSEDILAILENGFKNYDLIVDHSDFFLGENNTLRLSQSGQIKVGALTEKQTGVLSESLGDILGNHGLIFLM